MGAIYPFQIPTDTIPLEAFSCLTLRRSKYFKRTEGIWNKKRNEALFSEAVHNQFFWLFSKFSMFIIVGVLSPAVHALYPWLIPSIPAAGVFLLAVSVCIIWAHIFTAPELFSPAHDHCECSVLSHLPTASGRGRDPRERSHQQEADEML